MSNNHEHMWQDLGLDLPAHDGLLKLLGRFYGDIYLSQQGRASGTRYLDFVISEIHGLRIKELLEAKAAGGHVVGTFCVFAPEELIWAAGATCVGLCAGADVGTQLAERILPRNTCALIKAFVGFKLARVCPFMETCDFLVGETTCDGKKKAYELLHDYKSTYVMEIPQMKREADRALWKAEMVRFKDMLEERRGKTITAESLGAAIKMVNDRRRALQRLAALRTADPAPISGRDALLVNQIAFYDDPPRFTAKINDLCAELQERVNAGQGVAEGAPRVIMAGCPMAVPNWKLPYLVESSGAVIVGEESCVGERATRDLVAEDGRDLDEMLDRLVERYMHIDCACFTPNQERLDHITDLARRLGAAGVIQYTLQFCGPYTMEAHKVEQRLAAENIPTLRLETDYSMEDLEQLKTRVEAFVEVLKAQ
ncbi:MAG: double-cubane-cluster-containing anaerobic reductase [Pseudomonadota bacterium]